MVRKRRRLGGVDRSQSSARQDLVELFDREFDAVYQFVLARSGDRSVADEVASETFLAAAQSLERGAEDTIGLPWLYVVARRRLIDYWRRTERERNRIDRLLSLDPTARQHGSDDEYPSDRKGDDVLLALQSLPERQRAALVLRYLDDYSVSEVAEAMDIPYRAAESLLSRGRRSFISAWEEK